MQFNKAEQTIIAGAIQDVLPAARDRVQRTERLVAATAADNHSLMTLRTRALATAQDQVSALEAVLGKLAKGERGTGTKARAVASPFAESSA